MRIISILLMLLFSQGIVAMQQSKELNRIWVLPLLGHFQEKRWPTYVTDKIYFEKSATLSQSHSDKNLYLVHSDSRKAIEQSIAEQIDSEKLRRHAPVTRHVPITILTHNQDNVLIMMGGVHSPNTPIFKITKEGIERKIADDTEIPAIHDRNPITHYRNGRYASYYIKDAQEHLLYTSRKPHVIFKDNEGNLHTIKEEKLTVPILGLLSFILGDMCTFLIRYHDVQLTRVDTNAPTLTDASHIILQSNPFGWKNAIRTVNFAFVAICAWMAYNKLYA